MVGDTDIEIKVFEIIAEQLGIPEDEITLESKFSGDLGADFLDLLELFLSFEEEFEIEIPTEAASVVKSVGDVIEYLGLQKH